MILADLPPAGDRVESLTTLTLPEFQGYFAVWLDCGTSALALALLHARQRRLDLERPEVIIPAYACPDLVAAAVYAGVSPVIVDIGGDDPGFDLDALGRAFSEQTLAVIAVNFLGIRERVREIKACLPAGVLLLEDNAQWYPELGDGISLEGDYVITSFARGKPASVLGGGLLLLCDGMDVDPNWLAGQVGESDADSLVSRLRYRSKTALYNLLRHPRLYFWLNRNPLLKLGATRFKPLQGIGPMPSTCQSFVNANVRRHLAANRWREDSYDKLFEKVPVMQPLGTRFPSRRGRQLRYSVLCQDRRQRDGLLADLQARGLGASSMYKQPLLEIDGVAELARCGETPRYAKVFADRLLTLPLHSGVTDRHVREIEAVFRSRA